MRARRTAATTTALLASLALAGCEKPTPPVTVYSSGTAVDTRASLWCFEGQTIEEGCRETDVPVAQVPVKNGNFTINVDSEVAHRGWYVEVNEQQSQEPLFEDHLAYNGIGQLPAEGVLLDIVVTDGEDGGDRETGRYRFQLVPE